MFFIAPLQEFVCGLDRFKELSIFNRYDGSYNMKQTEAFRFISSLWSPILTSYWVICSYIVDSCDVGKEYPADILIKNCKEHALELFLKGCYCNTSG